MKKSCLFCKKHNKVHVICELEELYFFTGQKLIRPSVNWFRVIAKTFTALALGYMVTIGLLYIWGLISAANNVHTTVPFVGIYAAIMFLVCLAKAKSIMICIIRIYQRYAPYQTRATCLFVPNCSEYMILAIQKYGIIKGVKMGIARFNRCEYPNGGIDYP